MSRDALPSALGAAALVSPSLLWLARDRSVWPWDQAWYGQASVNLFYALFAGPRRWWQELLSGLEAQAPGVAWLGHVFVPVGLLLRSVDDGLLLSVLLTHAGALALVAGALLDLTGRRSIAGTGALMMAAAPLFVGLSHQYFSEPLQLLAVAWSVRIMAAAPRWSGPFTLAQLAAASVAGLLAKVSTPLYCLGPALVALGEALPRLRDARSWREPRTWATAVCAVLLGVAAAAWYGRNSGFVKGHVAAAMTGPIAEIYGRSASLPQALAERLFTLATSFFLPWTGGLVVAAVLVAAAWPRRPAAGSARLTRAALVGAAQIGLVVMVLALSPNREARYLLPLLPYVALMAGAALARGGRRWLTATAAAGLAVQLALAHGQGLGLVPFQGWTPPWVIPPRVEAREAAVLDALAWRTCQGRAPRAQRYWNVVGIELPWLNKNSASFSAAKVLGPHGLVGCRYDSVYNFSVFEADALWELVGKMDVRYYVTRRPRASGIPPDDAHLVAVNRNYVPLLERVRASAEFVAEPPLTEDRDMLIYRRTAPEGQR